MATAILGDRIARDSVRVSKREADLDQDRLAHDSWLLPPIPPSPTEKWVRRISIVSGPVLLVAVAAFLIWLFFGPF
jgi:nitric oxide synthase oxygenase domain/subunit